MKISTPRPMQARLNTPVTPKGPSPNSNEPDPPQDSADILKAAGMGAIAGGVLVGAPAAVGALAKGLSGPAKLAIGYYAPGVAAVGAGGLAAYKTYKGLNPSSGPDFKAGLLASFAGLASAAAVGVGTQVGIVPGLTFGAKGAIFAAVGGAVALGGAFAYMEASNQKNS